LSSSPRPRTLRAFVEASLAVLRTEQTLVYLALCRTLAGRSIFVRVDDEACRIVFSETKAWVDGLRKATVEIVTTKTTVLDVLRAELSLQEAIDRDRLIARGPLAALTLFHEGLSLYVRGAVRCVGFPLLYDWYRR
jgi:hypothetical protein